MASGAGHFDQQGNACVKFNLCGVAHDLPGPEYEGIIDTGFTGFIQLPFHHAFALKLPLEGTHSYTLADGSQGTAILALARVSFNGKSATGAVSLSAGSADILLGMDFLRQLGLGIIILKGTVVLLDEDALEKITPKDAAPPAPPTDAA